MSLSIEQVGNGTGFVIYELKILVWHEKIYSYIIYSYITINWLEVFKYYL